jgi:hypothetical protein
MHWKHYKNNSVTGDNYIFINLRFNPLIGDIKTDKKHLFILFFSRDILFRDQC